MKPQVISDDELTFPVHVKHLMPPYDEIPEEFRRGRTVQNAFFNKWFFSGADATGFTAKTGINATLAWRHLTAIASSYEPKHEHKEAAVAYLLSQWFEGPTAGITGLGSP